MPTIGRVRRFKHKSIQQICPGLEDDGLDHSEYVIPKSEIRSYPSVKWEWQHREDWKEYDDKQKNRIEHAFEMGFTHVRLKSGKTGAVPMEIFFHEMIQYDPVSGNSRPIRRSGPDHFWLRARRNLLGMFHHHDGSSVQDVTFEQFRAYAAVRAGVKMTPEMRENLLAEKQKSDLFADSRIAHVVKSHRFEMLQLLLIMFNVAWLGYDADRDAAPLLTDEPVWYQFMSHLWCILFVIELLVRLFAYKSIRHAAGDGWFLFDSSLVMAMVLETWIIPLFSGTLGMKNLAVLRLARILRLTRIGRIARFLRTMPEIMTLLKGIGAALRSVFFTLVLLTCFLFVFGMLFKTQLEGKNESDAMMDDASQTLDDKFGTLADSMWTLLMAGVFIDGFALLADLLRAREPAFAALFLIFAFLSSFAVLNMLIGIICEVASTVSSEEKEQAAIQYLKNTLLKLIECFDVDDDRHIRRDEFELILRNPEVCIILANFGVNVNDLISLKDHLFEENDFYEDDKAEEQNGEPEPDCEDKSKVPQGKKWRKISFGEFLSLVLRLRGGNKSTVIDIVDLRENLSQRLRSIENQLTSVITLHKILDVRNHSSHHTAKDCAEILHDRYAHSNAHHQARASTVPVASGAPVPGTIPVVPVIPVCGVSHHSEDLCGGKPSSTPGEAHPSQSSPCDSSAHQMLLEIRQQLADVHHEQKQLRLAHESMSKNIQQIQQQQLAGVTIPEGSKTLSEDPGISADKMLS